MWNAKRHAMFTYARMLKTEVQSGMLSAWKVRPLFRTFLSQEYFDNTNREELMQFGMDVVKGRYRDG